MMSQVATRKTLADAVSAPDYPKDVDEQFDYLVYWLKRIAQAVSVKEVDQVSFELGREAGLREANSLGVNTQVE